MVQARIWSWILPKDTERSMYHVSCINVSQKSSLSFSMALWQTVCASSLEGKQAQRPIEEVATATVAAADVASVEVATAESAQRRQAIKVAYIV